MNSFSRTVFKGFTLIEVMVSLVVFLIIMTALSQTFISSFSGYKNVRAVQRDVENVQFALNLMAKELRTSTVVFPSSGSLVPSQSVKFYDYSQKICFEYKIVSGNQLTVAKKADPTPNDPPDPSADCSSSGFGGAVPIAKAGILTGQFIVTPSKKTVPKSVGKVTVSLQISEGPNHTAHIQTTSSLRDYGYIRL